MNTYLLGTENNQPYIQCLQCGLKSFNQNDIKYRYCGHCHIFHEYPNKETLLTDQFITNEYHNEKD